MDRPRQGGGPLLTVDEFRAIADVRVCRASVYEAIRRKQLPSVRIGRRIFIPRVAAEKFLAGEWPQVDQAHGS